MINYHELPLVLSTDATVTYKKIREVVKANKNTIRIEKDSDLQLHLRGLGGNSSFYFQVYNPKLGISNASTVTYTAEYSPKSAISIGVNKQNTVGDSILKILNGWLVMLQKYNSLRVHPSDNISDQYENEFEGLFEMAEDNADTRAFDTSRQVLIINAIDKSILALKEAKFEDEEIIREANELRDNISSLTMNEAFNSIKRLYGKLKFKGGLKAVKLVYEVCRNEAISMSYHLIVNSSGTKLLELLEKFSS